MTKSRSQFLPNSDFPNFNDASSPSCQLYGRSFLNVNSITPPSFSEGVGLRKTIFLQGCLRFCPGCKNYGYRELIPNKIIPVKQLALQLTRHDRYFIRSTIYDLETSLIKIHQLMIVHAFLWWITLNEISKKSYSGYNTLKYQQAISNLLQIMDRLIQPSVASNGKHLPSIPIQGITFSGGEPLLQNTALFFFIDALKYYKPNWDIWLYTGYSFNDLYSNRRLHSLFMKCDVAKCGAYEDKSKSPHFYYGSSNQELIDIKATFKANQKTLYKYPEYVQDCIAVFDNFSKQSLYPVLKSNIIHKINNLSRSKLKYIENFEAIFGPISTDFYKQFFSFQARNSHLVNYFFLKKQDINVHSIHSHPIKMTEKHTIEIYLQGSNSHYRSDFDSFISICAPKNITPIDTLINWIETNRHWKISLPGKTDSNFLSMNLSLVYYLLKHQLTYCLLRSPIPKLDVRAYHYAAVRYLEQLFRFYTKMPSSSSIRQDCVFIRGGDPALQGKSLNYLCAKLKDLNFEIWLEMPVARKNIRNNCAQFSFLNYVDYLVCGEVSEFDFLFVHPWKSSISQEIICLSTNRPWVPRFAFSNQLLSFHKFTSSTYNLVNFHPPIKALKYYYAAGDFFKSIECYANHLGDLIFNWDKL